jgi:competence protein ComEC
MATALAQAGADVALTGRTLGPAEETAAGIAHATGRRARAFAADVTVAADVERLAGELEGQFGRVDILVNNAGTNIRGLVDQLSESDWDSVIDTNLKGPFLCARAFGPRMVARGWGRVINLGSILGVVALPGRAPYASSKAGVINLTRVLALEWAGTGVTANAICPGPFATEMKPAAPGRPGEVPGVREDDPHGAVGRAGGADGRRRLPGVRRLVVRHRQLAVRGWWVDGTVGKRKGQRAKGKGQKTEGWHATLGHVPAGAAGRAAGDGSRHRGAAGVGAGGKTLDIYIVDTEGGKAALFVTPAGQTVLVDSGNPGDRDVNRIMDVLKDAGVSRLDYLVSTHYHIDHIGGMQALAGRIPIAHFVDHGPSVEPKEQVPGFQAAYAELRSKAKHTVVKPGDKVPLTGVDWTIVTAAGEVLRTPLAGGGQPNPACSSVEKKPEPPNPDENAQSVGSVIAFGQFRAIDLGDLLWNEEVRLMCPDNPVGTVDLYLVTHHGLANSGSSALVHGVRPRVAVMQNGTRKGGAVAAYEIMRTAPGLEDIWQLHWSYNAGIEHNPAGVFIANVDDNETIANVLTAPPPAAGAVAAAVRVDRRRVPRAARGPRVRAGPRLQAVRRQGPGRAEAGVGRRPPPPRTARPTTSRCRPGRTARSPSRTAGMASARRMSRDSCQSPVSAGNW